MIPAEYTLRIYEGAEFGKRMQLQADAGGSIDLTGATVSMQIRQTPSAVTSKDWSSYITLDGANGVFTIDVPSSQTTDFEYQKGVYDIEIVTSGGKTHKLLYGEVRIVDEVTQ